MATGIPRARGIQAKSERHGWVQSRTYHHSTQVPQAGRLAGGQWACAMVCGPGLLWVHRLGSNAPMLLRQRAGGCMWRGPNDRGLGVCACANCTNHGLSFKLRCWSTLEDEIPARQLIALGGQDGEMRVTFPIVIPRRDGSPCLLPHTLRHPQWNRGNFGRVREPGGIKAPVYLHCVHTVWQRRNSSAEPFWASVCLSGLSWLQMDCFLVITISGCSSVGWLVPELNAGGEREILHIPRPGQSSGRDANVFGREQGSKHCQIESSSKRKKKKKGNSFHPFIPGLYVKINCCLLQSVRYLRWQARGLRGESGNGLVVSEPIRARSNFSVAPPAQAGSLGPTQHHPAATTNARGRCEARTQFCIVSTPSLLFILILTGLPIPTRRPTWKSHNNFSPVAGLRQARGAVRAAETDPALAYRLLNLGVPTLWTLWLHHHREHHKQHGPMQLPENLPGINSVLHSISRRKLPCSRVS